LKNAIDSSSRPFLRSHRVRLQRRQRRRRRLLDRHVELLDRRQRFAQSRPHRGRQWPERAEHAFLARGFALFTSDRLAGLAVGGAERDDVVAAERRDSPVDERLQPETLADVAADVVRQALVLGLAHRSQRFADAVVRHDVEERRLPELHLERGGERFVEHRVAGRVREPADDDAVLVGERERRER
jgi:hypothetical protein